MVKVLVTVPVAPVAFTGVRLFDADATRFLPDQTVVVDKGLAPGQYRFRLVVVNAAGASSKPVEVIVTVEGGRVPFPGTITNPGPIVVGPNLAKLEPIADDEGAMLDSTASPRKLNSRLSCQLKVTPEFDGLVVHTPPTQQ